MRNLLLVLSLAFLLAAGSPARSEQPLIACTEGGVGCQILQMVMQGGFSDLDVTDNVSIRVLSAALPRLQSLTEADFTHFTGAHQIDAALLQAHYHVALGHCLWADILSAPGTPGERETQVREVLLLFLRPADSPRVIEERALIRSQLSDEIIAEFAEVTALPADFLNHLFYSDDWRVIGE